MVLMGPAGAGKTHLANIWAARTGATFLDAGLEVSAVSSLEGPVVLEDVDRSAIGEALFHLINRAALPNSALLITARTPPSDWESQVADLRSRLNALPVAILNQPDDVVLQGLLQKLFAERNIKAPADLLSYLKDRIERSATAAFAVVEMLDEAADAQGRPLSRILAREVLGRHGLGGGQDDATLVEQRPMDTKGE